VSPTVGPDRWNQLLDRSPQATPFHRYETLTTVAEHTNATFYPMVGRANGDAIGLFPVFEKSYGPVSTLFSPAPDLKVTYLGPALVESADLTCPERERRSLQFINAALNCFSDRFDPEYMLVRTVDRYPDPRPFDWHGFSVSPKHTYVVDISADPEELLTRFSSDARSNIRSHPETCVIELAGPSEIAAIIEQVAARHEAQGMSYTLPVEVVVDLFDSLPDGVVRPYVVRVDGEFVGGMIALEHGDTVYRWQGGAKPDCDISVNDLLDWHIMQDASSRGVERYDLVGANNERIARYKAKFAPELRTFYSMIQSSRSMRVLSKLYKRFR
jgi:hypothetical protein